MENYPNEVIVEGSKIIEEILQDWATHCAADEDELMDDEAESARDVALLKGSAAKYRDSITTNPWIQSLLLAL